MAPHPRPARSVIAEGPGDGDGRPGAGPRWLNAEEQAAWRALIRMQAKLAATLNRELTAHADLSLQDYGVLVELSDRPDGRMRAYELGDELGWEKSRLSHHIARMERRGLVRRDRCPSDHRGLFVSLTPAGREALASAAPDHVDTVRRALVDVLSPAQLRALTGMSHAVLEALDHLDGAQPAEPCGGQSAAG